MMLSSLSTALLSLALVASPVILAQEQAAAKDAISIQTAAPEPPKAVDDSSPESTIFNGVEVPPIKQLTEDDFDKETSKGYWYVVNPRSRGLLMRRFRTYSDQALTLRC